MLHMHLWSVAFPLYLSLGWEHLSYTTNFSQVVAWMLYILGFKLLFKYLGCIFFYSVLSSSYIVSAT